MVKNSSILNIKDLISILNTIKDPEVPVISILDLGIVNDILILDADNVQINLSPTYTGCPAMDVISVDIMVAFAKQGIKVKVKLVIDPTWTTDMISEKGRKQLLEYGIAPPEKGTRNKLALLGVKNQIVCPQCDSQHTEMISQFGSTACKALFRCLDCLEPFDYFKCLR